LQVFNFNRLNEIADEPDFQRIIIESYLEDGSSCIAEIENLLASSPENLAEKISLSAHALKGSSYNVGAVAVGDVASTLEKKSREDDVSAGEELLRELRDRFKETQELLEEQVLS